MKQDLGCLLALGLLVGVLCIAYALAPTAVVLVGWTGAVGLLWWKVSRTANPAPPPVPEGAETEEVQVSYVQDKDNPQRWEVVRATEKRDEK